MEIGFTGTSGELTIKQIIALNDLFIYEYPAEFTYVRKVRHGDCIGGDETFHKIARCLRPDIKIHGHPGESRQTGRSDKRAYCAFDELEPTETYFKRNRTIVDSTDLLIGCPAQMKDPGYGGTWYTIKYARKQGKPIIIIFPDGSVKRENFDHDINHDKVARFDEGCIHSPDDEKYCPTCMGHSLK